MRLKPWKPFPSGTEPTGANDANFPLLDLAKAIGSPDDPPWTTPIGPGDNPTGFALLKGIAAKLGIPPGDGSAVTSTDESRKAFVSIEHTIGSPDDPPATDSVGDWSAISLMKGILKKWGADVS
jgi:hypothetical protein